VTDDDAGPPPDGPPVTCPSTLTGAGRRRIEAVLREELARAGGDAIAGGAPPAAVTAYLRDRAARLRSCLPLVAEHLADDAADDARDAGKLNGVVD
jgi:hypothetical protein